MRGLQHAPPAKPAHLHQASPATDTHSTCCEHLHVFDYVTTSRGNGVLIHIGPQKVGIILDATGEAAYFEQSETIEQIHPIPFVPEPYASREQYSTLSQEDEYQYLDPHGWPYNDPEMTDEYLIMCGFPTREAAGYPFPIKPAHVERLRGAAIVFTPKGRGKLWRNWDTQIGVILEGTHYVTFFYVPEEWARIVRSDEGLQGGMEETSNV
jgi:hypothetical protein